MSAPVYLKPVPSPDNESRPFWEGLKEHKFLVQSCGECGRNRYPATTYCPQCQSDRVKWIESTGKGSVFSWIVVRHPIPKEAYGSEVPYVTALIDLDENVRIVSNIVGCDVMAIAGGMRVQIGYDDVDGELTLPICRPL